MGFVDLVCCNGNQKEKYSLCFMWCGDVFGVILFGYCIGSFYQSELMLEDGMCYNILVMIIFDVMVDYKV